MTQRKNNCHVNDMEYKVYHVSVSDGILGLTNTKLSLLEKSLSQINSFYDFTNISGVISTVNVILFM